MFVFIIYVIIIIIFTMVEITILTFIMVILFVIDWILILLLFLLFPQWIFERVDQSIYESDLKYFFHRCWAQIMLYLVCCKVLILVVYIEHILQLKINPPDYGRKLLVNLKHPNLLKHRRLKIIKPYRIQIQYHYHCHQLLIVNSELRITIAFW